MNGTILSRQYTYGAQSKFIDPDCQIAAMPAIESFDASSIDADLWGEQWSQLSFIEHCHLEFDDVETPRLPKAVVQGARRLIRCLEDCRESPPTVISGSCDATIVFEWHAREGQKLFRSLEVLSEDEAEEFLLEANDRKTLRTVIF